MANVSLFINNIAADVVKACTNTGVFPSVVIAQGIQESGAGSSTLAQRFKNFFGHMASSSWSGKKGQTKPGGKWWRVYDSVLDSIAAHITVLKRPTYRLAGVLKARTPYEQALALQKAGYNVGSDRHEYAMKLNNIIKAYGLDQYDTQMQRIERSLNENNLAYADQPPVTRTLQTIFG